MKVTGDKKGMDGSLTSGNKNRSPKQEEKLKRTAKRNGV